MIGGQDRRGRSGRPPFDTGDQCGSSTTIPAVMNPIWGWVIFKFGCLPGALIGVAYGIHAGPSEYASVALAALGALVTGLAAERLIFGLNSGRRG